MDIMKRNRGKNQSSASEIVLGMSPRASIGVQSEVLAPSSFVEAIGGLCSEIQDLAQQQKLCFGREVVSSPAVVHSQTKVEWIKPNLVFQSGMINQNQTKLCVPIRHGECIHHNIYKEDSMKAAKTLLYLAIDSNIGDLAALEFIVGALVSKGDITASTISALWDFFCFNVSGTTHEQKVAMNQLVYIESCMWKIQKERAKKKKLDADRQNVHNDVTTNVDNLKDNGINAKLGLAASEDAMFDTLSDRAEKEIVSGGSTQKNLIGHCAPFLSKLCKNFSLNAEAALLVGDPTAMRDREMFVLEDTVESTVA
ncbi:hypothetical protein LOK49_LG03G03083 [Camellia lanceoleosa]|uniref:Uncharacterized protein n=1 Tax=Camellia lanceoleosa TaxID=1840588 RepID=A0ACC0I7V6_9ERIC|nr:hypothetical protein LOK49_LG03G03083 [Camellia lanceoleosa]